MDDRMTKAKNRSHIKSLKALVQIFSNACFSLLRWEIECNQIKNLGQAVPGLLIFQFETRDLAIAIEYPPPNVRHSKNDEYRFKPEQ